MGLFLAKHTEIRELNKMICASKFPAGGSMIYHIHLSTVQDTGLKSAKKTVNVKSYDIHKEI